MRRLIAAVALALCLGSSTALADPLQPIGLRVDGGEENWHAGSSFALRWSNPPGVAAVRYRLRDPDGQLRGVEKTLAWAATSIDSLGVSAGPGAYTAEVRLEDAEGNLGPPASATLRFDDSHPGEVEPLQPPGWIGRTAFPFTIHLRHPGGPAPVSGIRGYAVSADASPLGEPCAGAICTGAETDLQDGVEGDSIALGELPEGTQYVHAVAVSGAGVPSASVGTVTLQVDKSDPVTTLTGVPEGWSRAPVALTAHAVDADSGMASAGPGGPFTSIRIDDCAPIADQGDTAAALAIDSGIHTIAYYARDAAGNVNDGGRSNGLRNHPAQTAVVKIDREPPLLAFAPAQSPADPEAIEVRAADEHSGLDPTRGSIALRQLGSGERFTALPTTIEGGALRARWDSASFAPGEYEFRATAYDRAGNGAVTTTRAGGRPMRLRGPLKLPVRLALAGRSGALGYGGSGWFGGRLLTGRRTPLAGAQVRIVERFAAGSSPAERISTVRSSADGSFGLRLRPGPSRHVSAEVESTLTTRAVSSEPLAIAVHGRLALHVSAPVARVGGRPIVFRGRVAAAGTQMPSGGKLVQLQFRLAGTSWSEFRTVRTDGRGRFRYAYRFADDDSRGVRFQFRAYAPAQAGWPYEPAGSLPVSVLGT